MTIPYHFRIMAALPGHSPIELFRASRRYLQADWDWHTRDLSPEWECWVEYTLADRDTITPRPQPARRPAHEDVLPLTRLERVRLRDFVEVGFND